MRNVEMFPWSYVLLFERIPAAILVNSAAKKQDHFFENILKNGLNPFHTAGLFQYRLKISGNLWF